MGQTAIAEPMQENWQVELGPFETHVQGEELVVSQGSDTLKRKNIVIGDIWLGAGQSNMQMSVEESAGKAEALANPVNPAIRLFTVKRDRSRAPRQELLDGQWQLADSESVPSFSAVGYYFGRDLQKSLNVPIGLISVNQGGTTAERWMSREAINANPDVERMKKPQGASDLYNAMIAPLEGHAVKGVLWYQGESNADRGFEYRFVLNGLIRNWRDVFKNQKLPFLIVELAPFKLPPERSSHDWAAVRESQQWVAAHDPLVGSISIVDLGDESEHPLRKREVGERLAHAARHIAYGEQLVFDGPVCDHVAYEGNMARVHFKNAGGGLKALGGNLIGFTMAGADGTFYPAKASIHGDAIELESDQVPKPIAVRLGWDNYPKMNLSNDAGLPAHPFRSDQPVVNREESATALSSAAAK